MPHHQLGIYISEELEQRCFSYLLAKKHGGQFILRIEDTDRERLVEGSLDIIKEGLTWLGITWDEGPEKGGEKGPYIQSERFDIYTKYAEQLLN